MDVKLIDYVEPIFANAELKGFHKSWTLKQKLMLIITELSEFVESDRKDNICGYTKRQYFEERIELLPSFPTQSFENNIKDTLEDELADAFIRICDLLGLMFKNFEAYERILDTMDINANTDTDLLAGTFQTVDVVFNITQTLVRIEGEDVVRQEKLFGSAIAQIYQLAKRLSFPLQKHVEWKMQYNASRPTMHGGRY